MSSRTCKKGVKSGRKVEKKGVKKGGQKDFTPFFGTLRPFFARTLRPLTLRPFWGQNDVKKKFSIDENRHDTPPAQVSDGQGDGHSRGFL